MQNTLDLSSLKKASQSFDHAIAFARKIESKPPCELDFYEMEFARAAVIKHFELSYELCWKTMKRYIEMDIGAEADILTRKDLFRQAAERGLIDEFAPWVEFHLARNQTSHVYNETISEKVYKTAFASQPNVQRFVQTMERRV